MSKFLAGLISVERTLRQALENHCLQRAGDGGIQFSGRNGFSVDNFIGHRRHGLAGKWLFTRRHPIEDDTERKQVGAAIDGRAGKLLGRHESGRSQKLAAGGGLSGDELGDTKIRDLRPLFPVNLARSQQDIRGLDIAVNYAMAVRVPEGFGDLLAYLANAI
jgi:hypothetical protein